ncbi:hypothetical protein N6L24_05015 [Cognatishimia sp. SS12]|uniref:hypothetical protein n=1 Tax=Cognatishimia sp. SS12 TaxID=2979465 RepID=UPI00233107C1|nr:hypothetical protein [Cognatishimia sp. SS12]MDC0737629.1 hypothetical protein [Cognatishimia sp. SS12]
MDEITVMFELDRAVFDTLRDAADANGVSPADIIRLAIMRDLSARRFAPVEQAASPARTAN